LIQNYSEMNIKCLRLFLIIWNYMFLSGIAQVHCCASVFYLLCCTKCSSGESTLHEIVFACLCLCAWKSEAKLCYVPHTYKQPPTQAPPAVQPTAVPNTAVPSTTVVSREKRFSSPNCNSFPVPTHTNSCLPLPHPLSHQPQW